MGNCLVTKLKESVGNYNLPHLNGLRIKVNPFTSVHYINIWANAPLHYKILNNAFSFTDENGVSRGEYEVTTDAHQYIFMIQYGLPANSDGIMLVENKYDIEELTVGSNQGEYGIQTEDLRFMDKLTTISTNIHLSGNIQDLKHCSAYTDIYLAENPNLVGTLTDWPNAENVVGIRLQNTKVSGNITDLAQFINTSYLWFVNTEMVGSVEELVAAFVAQGKTSGSIDVAFNNGKMTYQGRIMSKGAQLEWVDGVITSFPVFD